MSYCRYKLEAHQERGWQDGVKVKHYPRFEGVSKVVKAFTRRCAGGCGAAIRTAEDIVKREVLQPSSGKSHDVANCDEP